MKSYLLKPRIGIPIAASRAFNKHNFLLACMPKSGSTHLSFCFAAQPNFRIAVWVPGFGHREQEIEISRIYKIKYCRHHTIAQTHVRYSEPTLEQLNHSPFSIIILHRNIYDVIASLYDHMHKESIVFHMAFVPKDFFDLSEENQLIFITDLCVPWYFNFYCGWQFFTQSPNEMKKYSWLKSTFTIHYEDLIGNEPAVVSQILKGAGLDISPESVQGNIEKYFGSQRPRTRFNKGVSRRGEMLIDKFPVIKEKVESFASHYPRQSFSKILEWS
jgi:hypothetical protein